MSGIDQLSASIGQLTARIEDAREQDREQFVLLRQLRDDIAGLRSDLNRHMAVEEQRDADVERRLTSLEEAMSDYRHLKAKAGGVIAVAAIIASLAGALVVDWLKGFVAR